jgi:O-succinylhomoserine sulfhydrylase
MTSSFTYDSAEHASAVFKGEQEANVYSRYTNPNCSELIQKLCLLEGTESGMVTASGMAAVYTSFTALLKSGDHIISSKQIFGNSKYVLQKFIAERGVEVTYVDGADLEQWSSAFRPNTTMVYIETPSNPTLMTLDMYRISELCKANNAIFSVDNCFATPYLQQPVKFGADLVIHSATKYIDGQGRVLGGAILGRPELIDKCTDFLRRTGASLSPFNAWVLSKSLETLAVRMDRHCSNAAAVADYLHQHSEVDFITYPHHSSNPNMDIAQRQMSQGGGLVGCQLQGGASRVMSFINGLKLHSLTANLGDTRSIATHPATTTHSKMTPEEQLDAGVTPGYLRLSVGLEHIDDILEDIEQSLKQSR